jgi:4-amino-4-deoxy-L-arabinose transferase-like glycosyltransferase
MPVLQDVIHKIEVGGGMRHLKLGVGALAIVGLFVFYNFRGFKNMSTQEAMDAAQLGRNIAQGKGYSTLFVRPLSMYLIRQHNLEKLGGVEAKGSDVFQIKGNHPDLANPPVYPVVLAGLMKILPFEYAVPTKPKPFWSDEGRFLRSEPDFLISLFNQLLFFAVVFLMFLLVRRLFEPRVAWLTASLIFCTEILWRFSVSGLSTMLLLLIFTGVIWCLVLVEQEGRELTGRATRLILLALAAGVLTGLGALTRYSFGCVILPVIVFLVFCGGPQRFVLGAVAALSFVIVFAPWIARNYHVGGTPFGTAGYAILEHTFSFPEYQLQRSLEPDLSASVLKPLTQKLLVNLRHVALNDLPKLGGGWISGFFLVGLLVGFREPGPKRLRYFLVSCILLLSVAQALGTTELSTASPEINSENLLILVAPLVLTFGVNLFFLFLDQFDLPARELRYAVIGIFSALVCLPMVFTLLPPKTNPVSYPPYFPPSIQMSTMWTKENELMMTDMPWATAWYGQTQCMWLTLTPHEFVVINDYQKPIQILWLSKITIDSKLWTQWLILAQSGWGNMLIQAQNYFTTDALLWPRQVNLRVFRPGEAPESFPLHFWQVGQMGFEDQFLLTAREHFPKLQ